MHYYNNEELNDLAYNILKSNGLSNINFKMVNLGFNRTIYKVNNEYILKICLKPKKEKNTINEINFLKSDNNNFHPKLICYDITKQVFPFIYSIEEYVSGRPLFDSWDNLSSDTRLEVLKKISLYMKKMHSIKSDNKCITLLENDFMECINVLDGKLPLNETLYLNELVNILKYHFTDSKECKIHGDLHFNNIIYNSDKEEIKFIDFESYGDGFIEEEFSTLDRMCENPNSLIKSGLQLQVNNNNYIKIIKYLKEFNSYDSNEYENRILVYNSLNALKWIATYPDKSLTEKRKILFDDSKKLFK